MCNEFDDGPSFVRPKYILGKFSDHEWFIFNISGSHDGLAHYFSCIFSRVLLYLIILDIQ